MERKPQLNLFTKGQEDDYRTAEYLAYQMLNLKTRTLGRNYPGCSMDLYNIGLLNFAMDDYGRAKRFLVRALQMQKNERKRPDMVKTLRTLALLHKKERSTCMLQEAC